MHVKFDFSDASVLVIGASRAGIGSAIARGFKDSGASVIVTGVEDAPAEQDRGLYDYRKLDVTDLDAVRGLGQSIGTVDVVVNCAAITARGEEMEPSFFQKVVDVNLFGTFRVAETFHRHLKARSGTLINLASMYARFGSPRNPAYGASKAAVEQLTRSLAIAWAADGIRVNAVAPGFIVTEQSARSRTDAAHVANVSARTPLARWGQPDDITGPVLFLASAASAFMTGTCLAVDGGYSVV